MEKQLAETPDSELLPPSTLQDIVALHDLPRVQASPPPKAPQATRSLTAPHATDQHGEAIDGRLPVPRTTVHGQRQ